MQQPVLFRYRRKQSRIGPLLASWGAFLLMGPAAALSRVGGANSGGGLVWDGYAKAVVASCYEDYQVATTDKIFSTFARPLLCEVYLADDDDAVHVLRGGGSRSNTTKATKENSKIVRIVRELRGGTSDSNNLIHFMNFTFIVTDEQGHDDEEASMKLSLHSEALLNKSHDASHSTHDALDTHGINGSTNKTSSVAKNSNSSDGGDGNTHRRTTTDTGNGNSSNATNTSDAEDLGDTRIVLISTTSTSNCESTSGGASISNNSSSATNSNRISRSRSRSSDTNDPEDTPADSSSINNDRKASKQRPFTSEIRLPRSILPEMSKKININRHNKDDAVSNLSGGSTPNRIITKHPIFNVFKKLTTDMSKSTLLLGFGHSHLVEHHAMFCPRGLWVRKPNCSLQAGGTRAGTLRSAEGSSKFSPSEVDGPVHVSTHPPASSTEDVEARGTEQRVVQSTNLLGSDPAQSHKRVIPLDGAFTDTLTSGRRKPTLWLGVDRSLRFEKNLGTPSSTHGAGGGRLEPGVIRPINLLTSRLDKSPKVVNARRTVLQEDSGGRRWGGHRPLQSTNMLSSDIEKPPEVPSTQRIVIQGQGGSGGGTGPGAMLPMNLLSSNPETVREVLKTRKISIQVEDDREEVVGRGEKRPTKVQATNPEKERGVLTTPITKSGTIRPKHVLSSHPELVREGVATRATLYQEEDSTRFKPDSQKVPDVLKMQGTGLPEDGGYEIGSSGDIKGTVGGWLPWPPRNEGDGLDHIFAATTDMEEPMGVSVPKRGSVLTTVDGATTVSRSGHFRWDWVSRFSWKRPKDHGHDLKVAEDVGIQFSLGGRTVYAISEDEWMG